MMAVHFLSNSQMPFKYITSGTIRGFKISAIHNPHQVVLNISGGTNTFEETLIGNQNVM